jgi:hypothetical protein
VEETLAGLFADLVFGVTAIAWALCAGAVVVAMCADALAATVVGATATVRCVTVAPRSTQRSGSSGHPDANAEPADITHAVNTAMVKNGRSSFTNGLREVIPALEWQRLYNREPFFMWFLSPAAALRPADPPAPSPVQPNLFRDCQEAVPSPARGSRTISLAQ